jgi:hypothetical protein
MGKWLNKFSDTRTDSVATVDTVASVSTVSVPTHRHSESFSGGSAVAENPNSRTDRVDTIDILNSKSLLGNTDTLDRLDNSDSQCTHFRTDSVDTLDDTFLESPSVSPDSPDALDTMSALSVLNQAHPENFPAVSDFVADPDRACPNCGSGQWWQLPGQAWHCRQCEPDMPLAATTLTLPCHKEQARPVDPHPSLERMFETACEGLSLTPGQLRQALKDDLESCGQLTALGLRLVAETLSAYLPPQNEAVAMLRQHPRVTHAFATDDDSDPDYVIVTLAIRNKATVDLRIARDKYDGLAILEWIEQHTSGDLQ